MERERVEDGKGRGEERIESTEGEGNNEQVRGGGKERGWERRRDIRIMQCTHASTYSHQKVCSIAHTH